MIALGFELAEASDGYEALLCLSSSSRFDLMLVDTAVRGVDAIEFIRRVRAAPEHSRVPIILIGESSLDDRLNEALEAGASEYIMKPLTLDVLVPKLDLLGIEHR